MIKSFLLGACHALIMAYGMNPKVFKATLIRPFTYLKSICWHDPESRLLGYDEGKNHVEVKCKKCGKIEVY